jgi:hypothetical protein
MKFIQPVLLTLLTVASLGAQAKYNGEDRGRPVMPAQMHAKWQTECSSCHVAYPPGLLPAASWTKIMSGLDKHFGTDASLAPQDTQEITDYLTKHASNRWNSSAAPLRITESQWWRSKHDEVRAAVWSRASVKSRSNCSACHQGADKGDFDEDRVHIPK